MAKTASRAVLLLVMATTSVYAQSPSAAPAGYGKLNEPVANTPHSRCTAGSNEKQQNVAGAENTDYGEDACTKRWGSYVACQACELHGTSDSEDCKRARSLFGN